MVMAGVGLELLVRRLRASGAFLSDTEAAALCALPFERLPFDAGAEIFDVGSTSLPSYVVLDGCLSRFKRRQDGVRVNVSFDLPGDLINIESLLLDTVDCGARANSHGVLAVVDPAAFRALWAEHGHIEAALWRHALVKAAALEEWLLNVGRRSATARIAHLFSELRLRLSVIEPSPEYTNRLHATPQEIARAMGLQEVHVSRVLNEFSSRRLIERVDGVTILLDPERLATIGDFQAGYLHLVG